MECIYSENKQKNDNIVFEDEREKLDNAGAFTTHENIEHFLNVTEHMTLTKEQADYRDYVENHFKSQLQKVKLG